LRKEIMRFVQGQPSEKECGGVEAMLAFAFTCDRQEVREKRLFWRDFILKTDDLPRQARDNHRECTQNKDVFSQGQEEEGEEEWAAEVTVGHNPSTSYSMRIDVTATAEPVE
jgi:hypothetical protein